MTRLICSLLLSLLLFLGFFSKAVICYNLLTSWRNNKAFTALHWDGTVTTWGNAMNSPTAPSGLSSVQGIYSTQNYWCALHTNGQITTWSNDASTAGANPGSVTNVYRIVSNDFAFAAIHTDDSVTSWGIFFGGNPPASIRNVKMVYPNTMSFVALHNDGTVTGWGFADGGGSVPSGLSNIVSICSTQSSYLGIKEDSSIVVWGNSNFGGSVSSGVTNVKECFSSKYAFAVITHDNKAFAWGAKDSSGLALTVPSNIQNVQSIYTTVSSFCALHYDKRITCWGDVGFGGATPQYLSNVSHIFANEGAFTALLENKTAISWGGSGYGGYIPGSMVERVEWIYCSRSSFAALHSDSTMTSWGQLITPTLNPHKNITSIFATDDAYILLFNDSTTYAYGATSDGGGTLPAGGLTNVQVVFGIDPLYNRPYHNSFDGCPLGYGIDYTNTDGLLGTIASKRTCKACSPGYYRSSIHRGFEAAGCTPCEVGYYQSQSGQTSCMPCPIGTYQNTTGMSYCYLCPIGTANELTAQTGLAACIDCIPGKYQTLRGQSSCVSCSAGTIQPASGQTYCDECPTGTAQPLTAQITCNDCSSGTYNNLTGQATCTGCDYGKYNSYTKAVNESFCLHCQPGEYQPMKGNETCQQCPGGFYVSSSGQANCTACGVGKYQPLLGQVSDAACTVCPIGKYNPFSGANSLEYCIDCSPGYVQPLAGASSCHACPLHEYQPIAGQMSCMQCSNAYFTTDVASLNCTLITCSKGYIFTRNDLKCMACLYDDWCPDGIVCEQNHQGKRCAHCNDGYFMLNENCVMCNKLSFVYILVIGGLFCSFYGVVAYRLAHEYRHAMGWTFIVITHFQTIALFTQMKLGIPTELLGFMRMMNAIFGARFIEVLFIPKCYYKLTYYYQWMINNMIPICLLIIMFLYTTFCRSFCRIIARQDNALDINGSYSKYKACTVVLMIIYMYALEQAWSIIDCVKLSDDRIVLEDDSSIECYTVEHYTFAIVGVCLAISYTTWIQHIDKKLRKADKTNEVTEERFGYLYHRFTDYRFWWESRVELSKKWLLVIIQVFVHQGNIQAGCYLTLLLLYFIVHLDNQPYMTHNLIHKDLENQLQSKLYIIQIIILCLMWMLGDLRAHFYSWNAIILPLYLLSIALSLHSFYNLLKRQPEMNEDRERKKIAKEGITISSEKKETKDNMENINTNTILEVPTSPASLRSNMALSPSSKLKNKQYSYNYSQSNGNVHTNTSNSQSMTSLVPSGKLDRRERHYDYHDNRFMNEYTLEYSAPDHSHGEIQRSMTAPKDSLHHSQQHHHHGLQSNLHPHSLESQRINRNVSYQREQYYQYGDQNPQHSSSQHQQQQLSPKQLKMQDIQRINQSFGRL
jgi:hypothetical protein